MPSLVNRGASIGGTVYAMNDAAGKGNQGDAVIIYPGNSTYYNEAWTFSICQNFPEQPTRS